MGGEKIYKDFAEFLPPGTQVVYLLLFRLFGLCNWIPNLVAILVGLISTWLVAFVSRKVIRTSPFLALLPGFLLLTYHYLGEIHRWLSSAAVFGALAVLMEERSRGRVIWSGVLCGLASFFTQTQGIFAVAGLLTFLFWESHQDRKLRQRLLSRAAWLVVAFIATVLTTCAYFIWRAGMSSFLDNLVTFPLFYHPLDRENFGLGIYFAEFPSLVPLSDLPHHAFSVLIHILVPFIYIVFLAAYRRWNLKTEESIRLMLINIVGLFLFASVAPAATYFRLFTVSAPALIILCYCLRGERWLSRLTTGLLLIAGLYALACPPMQVQMSSMSVLQLPRGPIAFAESESVDRDALAWLTLHTKRGDIFFVGDGKGLFFPTTLRPKDKTVGYDNTGQTRAKDVQDAIETLRNYRVKFIQWPPESCPPRFYDPGEDHLQPLSEYVQMNYHFVKQFNGPGNSDAGPIGIWQRNE